MGRLAKPVRMPFLRFHCRVDDVWVSSPSALVCFWQHQFGEFAALSSDAQTGTGYA